jgi:hypothetical protein
MGINIGTEDRYVIVEATGIEKKTDQSERLAPSQARDMAEKLEELSEKAEEQ